MARETTMDYDNVNDDIVVSINDDDNNEPVATHSMKKYPTTKYPCHHINHLRNGLNEGPISGPCCIHHWTEHIAIDKLPDSFSNPNACFP